MKHNDITNQLLPIFLLTNSLVISSLATRLCEKIEIFKTHFF